MSRTARNVRISNQIAATLRRRYWANTERVCIEVKIHHFISGPSAPVPRLLQETIRRAHSFILTVSCSGESPVGGTFQHRNLDGLDLKANGHSRRTNPSPCTLARCEVSDP